MVTPTDAYREAIYRKIREKRGPDGKPEWPISQARSKIEIRRVGWRWIVKLNDHCKSFWFSANAHHFRAMMEKSYDLGFDAGKSEGFDDGIAHQKWLIEVWPRMKPHRLTDLEPLDGEQQRAEDEAATDKRADRERMLMP